jgi:hypothetical protein
MIAGGCGRVFEPGTESGWSQQAAGVIHWQCWVPSRSLLPRMQDSADPATADPATARRPTSRVPTAVKRNARERSLTLSDRAVRPQGSSSLLLM